MTAQLSGIAIRAKKHAKMEFLESAEITLEHGVATDFRGKPGKRQVTVLAYQGWQAACSDAGVDLDWTERRANLLVDGLDLCNSAGHILEIGTVQLLITQETDPCKRMEEQHQGLCDAMAKQWRGGVCCRVLRPGRIHLGDKVALLNAG